MTRCVVCGNMPQFCVCSGARRPKRKVTFDLQDVHDLRSMAAEVLYPDEYNEVDYARVLARSVLALDISNVSWTVEGASGSSE